MKKINVGIIGFGTVGAGTFEALSINREIIADRVGAEVAVRKIADLDIDTDRGISVTPGRECMTTDAMKLINDPEIQIVVELMGGLGKAKEFILKAMENGKHVVTANKALLAEHGEEIYKAADRKRSGPLFRSERRGRHPHHRCTENRTFRQPDYQLHGHTQWDIKLYPHENDQEKPSL